MKYQKTFDGTIELECTGTVKVTPDVVVMDYCVVTTQRDAAFAKRSVEEAVSKFFEELKAMSLDEEASAGQISVQPTYSDKDVFGRRELVGYEVSRHVQVRIHDFSQICKVNNLALDCGLNRITGCDYMITDPKKYEDEAAHKAAEEIKHQADLLSHEFGLSLGKPCRIEYTKEDAAPRGVLFCAGPSAKHSRLIEQPSNDEIEPVYKPDLLEICVTIKAEFTYQH